jgi:hypothetical protein
LDDDETERFTDWIELCNTTYGKVYKKPLSEELRYYGIYVNNIFQIGRAIIIGAPIGCFITMPVLQEALTDISGIAEMF